MSKKIIITAGGTGGHIFPAMALAKQLLNEDPQIELLFVGGNLSANKYFDRNLFPYKEVSCGSLPLRKPIKALINSGRILRGLWESKNIIKAFNPQIVVGFGSFYTLPTLLAAKLKNIPIVLHEANRIPGKVNRLLSRYATLTGVHFPDTIDHLKGNALEVAVPLRDGYLKGTISKETAKTHYHLDPKRPVILVFGGSQGAHSMNHSVSMALAGMSDTQLQVLHFTGDPESAQKFKMLYDSKGVKAHVKAFEPRMDIAWQASDLMISRSGAGTVAELMEFEVPGILIPYPFATDNHQESNADFVVQVVKGAEKCIEKHLSEKRLADTIRQLLENDNRQLKAMQAAINHYKQREQPRQLSTIVREILK